MEVSLPAPPMMDSGTTEDQDSRIDESMKKMIPHYALPNVAAILPDYSNTEQDTIRQAFHGGSCESGGPSSAPTPAPAARWCPPFHLPTR